MEKVLASKIQLGIYVEEAENEKSTKYNLPFLVKLSKDIDVEKGKYLVQNFYLMKKVIIYI